MSTQPGVVSRPRASTSRRPAPERPPTDVILVPSIATSPARGGAPVPSMIVPPRRTRSCIQRRLPGRWFRCPPPEPSLLLPAGLRPGGDAFPRRGLPGPPHAPAFARGRAPRGCPLRRHLLPARRLLLARCLPLPRRGALLHGG